MVLVVKWPPADTSVHISLLFAIGGAVQCLKRDGVRSVSSECFTVPEKLFLLLHFQVNLKIIFNL